MTEEQCYYCGSPHCDDPCPKRVADAERFEKSGRAMYYQQWRAQATGTEAAVCRDIAERQQKGIAKYGTTVADNPLELEQWATHIYEEMLDCCVYMKRAITMMQEQRKAADT